MANNVLDGVRVADWTIAYAGPKGMVWLAALGAEVIKIEQAGDASQTRAGGDGSLRRVPTTRSDGLKILFENANYNKKSITVDLSKKEGREIVYRLVETSNVFTTNQLPDTIEKLGMDYETLRKYNPEIIYATNNIVGYKGPYRVTPGYEVLGQAVSGLMSTSGLRGQPPTPATCGIGDVTSGFAMFCGVVVALLHKQRTGKGQRVDTSQMQALMNIPVEACLAVYSMLSEEQRQANPYGGVVRADSREDEDIPTGTYYRCKDGKWIQLAITREKYFVNLAKGIGRPELAQDPRFSDQAKRREHNKELIKIFDEVFAEHTAKEWRDKFHGLDIPLYPVNELGDLLEDPQVLANDMLFTFEHPDLGLLRLPGMPFNLSESPGRVERRAPELGEHTEEVLLDLGYTWEEILKFREQKVV